MILITNMDEIKFVMNREDFLRLEKLLDNILGIPTATNSGTSKNAKEGFRLEFGSYNEYGKIAKLIATEAPVESLPITLNYDPSILDNPKLTNKIQREFPLIYRSMLKKSGKVSNSY